MISHKSAETVTENDDNILCEDFVKEHTKVIPGPRKDLFAMVLGAMPVVDGTPSVMPK